MVRVVPALAPYLSVSPTTTGRLRKGQTQSFTLTFSAAIDALPTTTQGVIQLREAERDGKQGDLVAQPLPVNVSVVWPAVKVGSPLGVIVNSPPTWLADYVQGKHLLALRNTGVSGPLGETKFATEAYFQLFREANRNPQALPIDAWYETYLQPFVPVPVKTRSTTIVSGIASVRIVIPEMGGDRVHVFVPVGTDVVEVAYGLYAPQFVPQYEAILNSIQVTN
jgi:hypothetical protein